ncbi:MAG TPA: IclR family transcriptional regulator, partial [Corynebacterium sp.]|nr:IclR family transcriptional regulator [Corynebacterium sp.]
MGQYSAESSISGIQVLDRSVAILSAVADSPLSLTELCTATGLPRATTHRLATALETHRILARSPDGKWTVGSWLSSFSAPDHARLIDLASPIMAELMHTTGESVQLYQLTGTTRTCVAVQEPASGLHNAVPVGSQLPLSSGSAAKVFLAYASPTIQAEILPAASFSPAELKQVVDTGLAESLEEREVGLGSLSAPVLDAADHLIAVLSVSGPSQRLAPSPARVWGK